MDTVEHTPGPWWVEDRRQEATNRGGGAIQVQAKHRGEGSSYCVASVNFHEAPEANARLISAAPDMLAALQELHLKTVIGTDEERHAALNQAWTAISKALGHDTSEAA